MAVTIALDDDLATALEESAKRQHLSIQQFATNILAHAVEESASTTPEEIVAQIQATPPNPASIRAATGNLAEALGNSPEDSAFNLQSWTRQWSEVQREMKAAVRTNDIAEGRGS